MCRAVKDLQSLLGDSEPEALWPNSAPLSIRSVRACGDFSLKSSINESRGAATWDSLLGWVVLNDTQPQRRDFYAPTFLNFLLF